MILLYEQACRIGLFIPISRENNMERYTVKRNVITSGGKP
jgi:hypothetical protein